MDPLEHVKRLREDYERALDAAESRRAAYHQAVVALIERGGPHVRELAEELGLVDQPVHQIVTRSPRRPRRTLVRVAGVVGGVIMLAGLTVAGLWLAQAPPFVPFVRVPRVLNMREAAAVRRIRAAGLSVRIVSAQRNLPPSLYHRVLGVSNAPDQQLAKGSVVTLYVPVPPTATHHSHEHS